MTHYQISCDGVLIHDSHREDVRVSEPSADFAVGASGQLHFELLPGHPFYDRIEKLRSEVTLWEDGEWVFSGRVLNDEANFLNIKTVEVEGELGYLNDSVIRPYVHQGDIRPLLQKFVTEHNTQVNADRRFVLGDVTVTDPNGYIYRESAQYPNTWREIEDKLPELLGGYLRTRRNRAGERLLDYLVDYGRVSSQVIRFGENLLDLEKYVKGEDVATGVIALGAKDKNDVRLTVKSVNGGKDYIVDEAAATEYGLIFKSVVYDDVTLAPNLLRNARAYLAAQRLLRLSLEISALDLSLVDVDAERFRVGDFVRVVSPPHALDAMLEVTRLHIDLEDPRESILALGATRSALTDRDPRANFAGVLEPYAKTSAVNQKISDTKIELSSEIVTSVEAARVGVLEEVSALLESEEWIPAELLNNWANFGGTNPPARYYKDALGDVHLSGLISGGAGTILRLPPGYLPEFNTIQLGATKEGTGLPVAAACRVTIRPNGDVVPALEVNNQWLSLDGVRFRAAKV